jgi:hypothetical protein
VQVPRIEEHEAVTIIVEAKGCWYYQLYKAMETQLVGRYLRDNECRHGLYLVGWFNCPQWDDEDRRKKTAARRDSRKVRELLETRATELSLEGLHIRSIVLNTALR